MHANIGKYSIQKLLGKGATASVYLGSDAFAGRDVAIKVLDGMPSDPEEARRQLKFFQNEASLAGKLRHPHIVRIFDAGVDTKDGKELPYLVMELVEGTSLQPHCDPRQLLPVARTAQIAYKCCKALEYANTAGVVHRDIKPANIMLQSDFDIKVADFGAAQLARSDTTQVAGVGSPAYMSRDERFNSWNDFAAALEPLLAEEDATMSSLSDVEEFSAMRRLAFFQRFSDTELWEVVRACRCRKFAAGADLIREGVADDQIYVLAAGMLKVTQRGKLLNAVSPGECVGEMVYARRSSAPRSATVTAMET